MNINDLLKQGGAVIALTLILLFLCGLQYYNGLFHALGIGIYFIVPVERALYSGLEAAQAPISAVLISIFFCVLSIKFTKNYKIIVKWTVMLFLLIVICSLAGYFIENIGKILGLPPLYNGIGSTKLKILTIISNMFFGILTLVLLTPSSTGTIDTTSFFTNSTSTACSTSTPASVILVTSTPDAFYIPIQGTAHNNSLNPSQSVTQNVAQSGDSSDPILEKSRKVRPHHLLAFASLAFLCGSSFQYSSMLGKSLGFQMNTRTRVSIIFADVETQKALGSFYFVPIMEVGDTLVTVQYKNKFTPNSQQKELTGKVTIIKKTSIKAIEFNLE